MGKGVSDLSVMRLVCIMPWNFSVGLKSDAPPLCNELSFIKSYISELIYIFILLNTKISESIFLLKSETYSHCRFRIEAF